MNNAIDDKDFFTVPSSKGKQKINGYTYAEQFKSPKEAWEKCDSREYMFWALEKFAPLTEVESNALIAKVKELSHQLCSGIPEHNVNVPVSRIFYYYATILRLATYIDLNDEAFVKLEKENKKKFCDIIRETVKNPFK